MFFVANWKMKGDRQQVQECVMTFRTTEAQPLQSAHNLILCPPYPYIPLLSAAGFTTGAQNCCAYEDGAYTGEVSTKMLADIGCKYVIIGHSERRKHFHEMPSLMALKLAQALSYGLTPILCIGELQQGLPPDASLKLIIEELEQLQLRSLPGAGLLAYEPVWAVGTGLTPTPEHISHIVGGLSAYTHKAWPVLYGGSVDIHNASSMHGINNLSGFLIGGASLPATRMLEIMQLYSSLN